MRDKLEKLNRSKRIGNSSRRGDGSGGSRSGNRGCNINDGWYDGISTREKNYPTGLHTEAAAIAIPHTDPQFIEKPYIAVIKPKTPIVFQPMAGMGDEVPAELIINLGVLRDGGQVAGLQNLMNIFMDKEKTADILAQTTQEGMVDAITKYFE